MNKRKFYIRWELECEIVLDSEVIDRVDDEWRASLYDLHTPEEIAEHIARNQVMNNWYLSALDGWADMRDEQAVVIFEYVNALEIQEEKMA